MLYLSFKFVRKFKFCVSPLVKRAGQGFNKLQVIKPFTLLYGRFSSAMQPDSNYTPALCVVTTVQLQLSVSLVLSFVKLRRKMLFERSNRRKRDAAKEIHRLTIRVKSHVNTPKYYIQICTAMNFAACIAENIIYEHLQMTDLKIIS